MNDDLATCIAIAINCASSYLRGLKGTEDITSFILEEMDTRGVDHKHYGSVYLIMDTLVGFSHAVRVAERNKEPIVPMMGEKNPPSR